jgi:hypothetical protein
MEVAVGLRRRGTAAGRLLVGVTYADGRHGRARTRLTHPTSSDSELRAPALATLEKAVTRRVRVRRLRLEVWEANHGALQLHLWPGGAGDESAGRLAKPALRAGELEARRIHPSRPPRSARLALGTPSAYVPPLSSIAPRPAPPVRCSPPVRTVVRSATLIAFSVACGYAKLILFPYLFFVELFSVAVFLSGVIVGVRWGLWVGAVARLVFSLANPYGPPHPWVLVAQVLGASFLGGLGGLLRRPIARWDSGAAAGHASGVLERRGALLFGAAGLVGTFAYDLLTNLALGIVFGAPRATLAVAALPALQHIASNVAIFAVVGGLATSWLRRDPRLLRHAA